MRFHTKKEPTTNPSIVQYKKLTEEDLFEVPADLKIYLFGTLSHRFLKEV
jgi:hypothetical protein